MAAAKKTEEIMIKKFEQRVTKIRIVGDSPLIVHNFDEKNKRMMLENQMGKSKTKKHPQKIPFDDFARALYWLTPMPTQVITDPGDGQKREVVTEELFDKAISDGAKFGFKVTAFKLAGNSAAYRMGMVKNQMALRGAYTLSAEYGEFAEIKGDLPKIREDVVVVNGGKSDLRYRPIFDHWYCDLILTINTGYGLSVDDIINVINAGGSVGVGEWRPEKDGIYGTFHVES